MNKFIFLLGIIGLLLACESCSERKKVEVVSTLSDSIESSRTEASFPFPEIPAMLTQPEERKAYLLEHYWDRFSFADTALVNNREVTEQGFVNQISLLADGATPEKVIREVNVPTRHIAASPYCRVLALFKGQPHLWLLMGMAGIW